MKVRWKVIRLDDKDVVVKIIIAPGQIPKICSDRKLSLSQYIRLVNMLAPDLFELKVGKTRKKIRA